MGQTSTFNMPKLRKWVLGYCYGRVLNVFGGFVRLQKEDTVFIHNDLEPLIDADCHYDAKDLDRFFPKESFDCAILDPPYTNFQAVHFYRGRMVKDISAVRDAVDKLIKSGGRVISLCYNTTGMSMQRGYQKEAILIVNMGGSHNDLLTLVERKTSSRDTLLETSSSGSLGSASRSSSPIQAQLQHG